MYTDEPEAGDREFEGGMEGHSLKPEMENSKENLKVTMINSYFVASTLKYCINRMKTCCY